MELRFQDKLKIAIEIAQGVRYMHEECPAGPVVHGELIASNIFLRHDLRPQVKLPYTTHLRFSCFAPLFEVFMFCSINYMSLFLTFDLMG